LQHTATDCSTLQHSATLCSTLHHAAHTGTENNLRSAYNTQQHTEAPCKIVHHCNMLHALQQRTTYEAPTTHCNTVQYPAHTATENNRRSACRSLSASTDVAQLYIMNVDGANTIAPTACRCIYIYVRIHMCIFVYITLLYIINVEAAKTIAPTAYTCIYIYVCVYICVYLYIQLCCTS